VEVGAQVESGGPGKETCCQEGGSQAEGAGEEEGCGAAKSSSDQGAQQEEQVAEISVKLQIAWIGKTKEAAIRALTEEYLERISRYVGAESHEMNSEAALLELAAGTAGRTAPVLVLLDARGRQFTSEEFASLLRDQQDRGTQNLFFAVGPANGFSDDARAAADLVLSFGKMTLAHELARVVLLEQVYRAFTILKGHPYHTGH
jgi:23S rRNA (pseudouridine1915-N3)-methyltransferase